MRILVSFLVLLSSLHAAAQESSPGQQIISSSPQLVVFAGSDANLQSLANGLALGQPVTLVTQTPDGLLQIATFTPPSALGTDTGRALEQARNLLISRGITQPSAQQIGAALMGGTILTASNQPLQLQGVLTGSAAPAANAVQVRNEFASGVSGSVAPFFGSPANFQALSTGLRQGRQVTLTGAGPNGTPQTVTFTPTTAL